MQEGCERQLAPKKDDTQLQVHEPVCPATVPPLEHVWPFGPVVHGIAISQFGPVYPVVQRHPQAPVLPIGVPLLQL